MALPIQTVPAIQWAAYGDASSLVFGVICDFSTYSQIVVQPSGSFGGTGILRPASGLIVDNLGSKETVTITIGQFVETVPPFTKVAVALPAGVAQVVFTASAATFACRATFYAGAYLGALSGTNYYNAQKQALLDVATGIVYEFAGQAANIPAGYLLCDGTAVSRTTYANLYSVIGTNFGPGDGSTTFNLPNKTGGKTGIGAGGAFALGGTGGEAAHILTVSEMPVHNHGTAVSDPGHTHSVSDPGHTHNPIGGGGAFGSGTAYAMSQSANGYFMNATSSNPTGIALFNATTGISVGVTNSGSGAAHNNMPPYVVFNYIIKT